MESDRKRIIIQVLRRASYIWKPRSECRKEARVSRGVYECNMCKACFKIKETVVDHITPIVDPALGFTDWNDYIEKMFCDQDGLQVLCKPCHKIKTDAENALRRGRAH